MGALFTLCILVTYLSLQPYGGDAAAFSGTVRCPCATSLAAYWELTLEQAMLVSDVVIMGRILELREGLRGTMNASIATMIAYKGHFAAFLMRMDDFTNFDHDAPRAMALFFFAREPAGNLALQCMTPLSSLYAVGDLKAVLDYVKDMGSDTNIKNDRFVPPDPNPCSTSPSPCPSDGSYCTVTNMLPGQSFKCTCLTGYMGNGHICEILAGPTTDPEPTPVHPVCGGVSAPLLDLLGNTASCNERDFPKNECPPMHYCHHGICCPVTPPSTMTPVLSPSPSPSLTPSTIPTPTPSPHPPLPPDTSDCGSGGEEYGECVDRGSGDRGSSDDRGSGADRGSGGSGDDRGSGGSGDEGSGSGLNGSVGEREYTFEDDEDMAYGQIRRHLQRRRRR